VNLKPLKNVKVTVPESLRAKAANEGSYSKKSSPSNKLSANTRSSNTTKVTRTVNKDKKTKQSVDKSVDKKQSVDKKVKPVQTEKITKREKPAIDEQKTQSFDFEEQIRENSIPDEMFDAKNKFSKIESRIALSAFAFIVFALAASWAAWDKDYAIVGNADVAYNYGLVGGIMMLVILVYALRKRSRLLRRVGDIKYWYYFHFIFGVIGPVLIVLHTSFGIRSINGGVALIAMFSIVFSGFIGRYIYTRASYGLRAVEQDLKVVSSQLDKGVLSYQIPILQPVEQQLRGFSKNSLSSSRGVIRTIIRILFIKHRAKLVYASASQSTASVLRAIAIKEKWTKSDYRERVKKEKILLQGHLNAVSSIASSRAFEKLAAKWRLLHVPILYVLVLSGLAHVLAVHMY